MMGVLERADKMRPAPLGIGRPQMTDQQRAALLVEMKSAVIDMATLVLAMSGDVPPRLRHYVKGLEVSIRVLSEEL